MKSLYYFVFDFLVLKILNIITIATIVSEIGIDKIQLVTISRPCAYGEYEPYQFFDSEKEFEEAVKKM